MERRELTAVRNPPVLCGLHLRWLREAYGLWPTGPAEDFKRFLKAAALETETCHYCLGLRGVQHFDCCQLLPDPDLPTSTTGSQSIPTMGMSLRC